MKVGVLVFVGAMTVLSTSCGDKSHKKSRDETQKQVGGNGSCTVQDVCTEQQEADASFGATCQTFGGQWSPQACDASRYETKCEYTGQVTEEGQEPKTVHYTAFYSNESKYTCSGKSTSLNDQAPKPEQEPRLEPTDDRPMAEPSTEPTDRQPDQPSTSGDQELENASLTQGIEDLKATYCTVTLKNKVEDRFFGVTLEAGKSYLLASAGSWPKVYAMVGDEPEDIFVERENIASSECDTSDFFAGKDVFPVDVSIYASRERSAAPVCTIAAGQPISSSGWESVNGAATVDFTSPPPGCGDLEKGYLDLTPLRVYPKGN